MLCSTLSLSAPSYSSHRRHWAWKNTLCGGFDASWGALGTIMKEMRLSSADVEEPEAPVCASNQGVG